MGTAKAIVVSQTRRVHEEIADLLVKIREVAKKTPNAGPPVRDERGPGPGCVMGSIMGGTPQPCGEPKGKGAKGGTPDGKKKP
jgi:hypothetical protein